MNMMDTSIQNTKTGKYKVNRKNTIHPANVTSTNRESDCQKESGRGNFIWIVPVDQGFQDATSHDLGAESIFHLVPQ